MNESRKIMRIPEGKNLLARLWHKITSLFEPEVVEVTFTKQGNQTNYTYTIVPNNKQVA